MAKRNYYKLLGVPDNATPEEIKEAYRKLMKEHHPDRYTGLRKKYEAMGDETLLRLIEEKI